MDQWSIVDKGKISSEDLSTNEMMDRSQYMYGNSKMSVGMYGFGKFNTMYFYLYIYILSKISWAHILPTFTGSFMEGKRATKGTWPYVSAKH
jgi:hypothetical protein